VSVSDIPLQ